MKELWELIKSIIDWFVKFALAFIITPFLVAFMIKLMVSMFLLGWRFL